MQRADVQHNFTAHITQLNIVRQAILDFYTSHMPNVHANAAASIDDSIRGTPSPFFTKTPPPISVPYSMSSPTGTQYQQKLFANSIPRSTQVQTKTTTTNSYTNSVPSFGQQQQQKQQQANANSSVNIDMDAMVHLINQTVANAIQQQLSNIQASSQSSVPIRNNLTNPFHVQYQAPQHGGGNNVGYQTFANNRNEHVGSGHSSTTHPIQYDQIPFRINVLDWRFHFLGLNMSEDPKSIDVEAFLPRGILQKVNSRILHE